LFFHGASIPSGPLTALRQAMQKRDIEFHMVNRRVMRGVLLWTKYEPLSALLEGPTFCIWPSSNYRSREELQCFNPEQENYVTRQLRQIDSVSFIKDALSLTQKESRLILMGGKVEHDYLMASQELREFAKTSPNLLQSRSNLLGLLNHSASSVVSTLQHPSRSLVGVIDTHTQQQQAEQDQTTASS
jgi:ribosomal protein L10